MNEEDFKKIKKMINNVEIINKEILSRLDEDINKLESKPTFDNPELEKSFQNLKRIVKERKINTSKLFEK